MRMLPRSASLPNLLRRVQKLTAPHLSTTGFRAAAEAAWTGEPASSSAEPRMVCSAQLDLRCRGN